MLVSSTQTVFHMRSIWVFALKPLGLLHLSSYPSPYTSSKSCPSAYPPPHPTLTWPPLALERSRDIFRDLLPATYLFGHIELVLFHLNWIYYNPTVGLCISIIVTTFSLFFCNCLFLTDSSYCIPSHMRRGGGLYMIFLSQVYSNFLFFLVFFSFLGGVFPSLLCELGLGPEGFVEADL